MIGPLTKQEFFLGLVILVLAAFLYHYYTVAANVQACSDLKVLYEYPVKSQ